MEVTQVTLALQATTTHPQVARHQPGGWGAFPAVAVDPADPSRLLAGADVGGLFASSDGGETWSVCTRQLETAFILDIRFVDDRVATRSSHTHPLGHHEDVQNISVE